MKFPLLFVLLASALQPAFAAVPVRTATVEQTAHAAERQIPGRLEAIPSSCAPARKALSPKCIFATGSM